MRLFKVIVTVYLLCLGSMAGMAYAQAVPTGDQLDQLVAPVALYPDTLLAQICAASTDPQQIADADNWLKQNKTLQGQALTDAAQKQGFDPAFISLVNFPPVLDMMAAHLDEYAALGAAFKADQKAVMASIQKLRQAAYASGALDSNEYQKVSTQQQGNTQVIVVQPANPQVVYVPQYPPQQVYSQPQPQAQASSGPSTGEQVAASLLTFGAGIAIGALIANNNQPYGWGGWGWGWGGGGVMVHNNVFVVNNRYASPRPYYHPRPVAYNRPVNARPPANWAARPNYRPPPAGYRPYGPNNPAYRPGYRPPPEYASPRPAPGNAASRPAGNVAATRPATPPPGNVGATRPPASDMARAAPSSSYAGRPGESAGATPRPQDTGERQGAFSGNNNGKAEREASNRGRESSGGGRSGGRHR